MYVQDKSSFRDDGTKTRWIVNINVGLTAETETDDNMSTVVVTRATWPAFTSGGFAFTRPRREFVDG